MAEFADRLRLLLKPEEKGSSEEDRSFMERESACQIENGFAFLEERSAFDEGERDAVLAAVAALEEERQAILHCINLFGDETLHGALDSAGLLMMGREAGSSFVEQDEPIFPIPDLDMELREGLEEGKEPDAEA